MQTYLLYVGQGFHSCNGYFRSNFPTDIILNNEINLVVCNRASNDTMCMTQTVVRLTFSPIIPHEV